MCLPLNKFHNTEHLSLENTPEMCSQHNFAAPNLLALTFYPNALSSSGSMSFTTIPITSQHLLHLDHCPTFTLDPVICLLQTYLRVTATQRDFQHSLVRFCHSHSIQFTGLQSPRDSNVTPTYLSSFMPYHGPHHSLFQPHKPGSLLPQGICCSFCL